MSSIQNCDDLEVLKNCKKQIVKAEKLKERLGERDFHDFIEEVFEPVSEHQRQNQFKQQQLSEKQTKALLDSFQTLTRSIKNQTKAITESSNALNQNLRNSIEKRMQEYE